MIVQNIDKKLLKSIIGRFDRNAFESFFQKLLNDSNDYHGSVYKRSNIDDKIFECPAERHYQSADAFFMCYTPYTIFGKFTVENLNTIEFKTLALKYISQRNFSVDPWLPIDGVSLYAVNNFDTEQLGISDEALLSIYENALASILGSTEQYRIGIGNINTFINHSQNTVRDTLRSFLNEYDDGICISISDNAVETARIVSENEFAGITKASKTLVQPVFKKIMAKDDIWYEFNNLILNDAPEKQLEDFLHQYYQDIFAGKYDRISTQVWLRWPNFDIGSKSRRLDMFLRNAVNEDWELFELKRADVKLIKSISDIPMLTAEVNDAIAQAKNYKHLLKQDTIKRALAADGIEYYEPVINLVIGKAPSISNAQWRRIKNDNENGLNILTYDSLMAEGIHRLEDILRVLM